MPGGIVPVGGELDVEVGEQHDRRRPPTTRTSSTLRPLRGVNDETMLMRSPVRRSPTARGVGDGRQRAPAGSAVGVGRRGGRSGWGVGAVQVDGTVRHASPLSWAHRQAVACSRSSATRASAAARSSTSMPCCRLSWYEVGRSSTGIVVAYSGLGQRDRAEVLRRPRGTRRPRRPARRGSTGAGTTRTRHTSRRRRRRRARRAMAATRSTVPRRDRGPSSARVTPSSVVGPAGGLRGERRGLGGRGGRDRPGAGLRGPPRRRRPAAGWAAALHDVDEVADDDGDVVGRAGPQRQGDQPVGGLARVGGGR